MTLLGERGYRFPVLCLGKNGNHVTSTSDERERGTFLRAVARIW
jgi:hypothetical protein